MAFDRVDGRRQGGFAIPWEQTMLVFFTYITALLVSRHLHCCTIEVTGVTLANERVGYKVEGFGPVEPNQVSDVISRDDIMSVTVNTETQVSPSLVGESFSYSSACAARYPSSKTRELANHHHHVVQYNTITDKPNARG
eukprot:scaffold846_cov168-Amphora_coffeaeformis.AAC.25